ncbi:MAG: UDP-N-acetylmuramoyl-L-alanine--D-glutamate ligase [Nitrospiraceae bacterium]|nr:MAG: UDP-N-acetylmuramoyl-L-alanine--D-glutamate ligase [Nitrospiraceae bacterium]
MIQIAEINNTMERVSGKFKDRNITVVGLARSGTGTANLLSLLGAHVLVTDIKKRALLEESIEKLKPSIAIKVGSHPDEIFISADLIVVSPGVPLSIPPLMKAREGGIPIIGELELAYQIVQSEGKGEAERSLGQKSPFPIPKFIGVTGTNGKSTTTMLIDSMLRQSGFQTLLGGNIGYALTEELYQVKAKGEKLNIDYVVSEVSSFQLESIQDFQPSNAVILNITPDHLDRYRNLQEYIDAKARIFKNQGAGDYLILNADDPVIMNMVGQQKTWRGNHSPHILFFSRTREVEGMYCKDGNLLLYTLTTSKAAPFPYLWKGAAFPPLNVINRDEIRIAGEHNLENAMAASLTAMIAGCPLESVRRTLNTFPGLEHRLEFVREIEGVKFINDSKGTNVGATLKSIESLQDIVLIMGGRDKGGDFTVLRNVIGRKVKALVLFGEARDKIARETGGRTEMFFVDSLEEAVRASFRKSSPGDTVLLSPGCASFDMFLDFEERGRKFKEAVHALGEPSAGE